MPFLAAKKWEMPRTPSMFFPDLVGIVFFFGEEYDCGIWLGRWGHYWVGKPWNSTMNGLHMLERMDKLVLLDIFLWKFIKHICWEILRYMIDYDWWTRGKFWTTTALGIYYHDWACLIQEQGIHVNFKRTFTILGSLNLNRSQVIFVSGSKVAFAGISSFHGIHADFERRNELKHAETTSPVEVSDGFLSPGLAPVFCSHFNIFQLWIHGFSHGNMHV